MVSFKEYLKEDFKSEPANLEEAYLTEGFKAPFHDEMVKSGAKYNCSGEGGAAPSCHYIFPPGTKAKTNDIHKIMKTYGFILYKKLQTYGDIESYLYRTPSKYSVPYHEVYANFSLHKDDGKIDVQYMVAKDLT